MKKQVCTFAMGALLAMGIAIGAPAGQNEAPQAADSAQAPRRHADPNRQLKMLTKRLNLTKDQQQQIRPILTDRQQQFESIRSDNSLSAEDRRAKMQAAREDSEAKIKAVLNDSQKQTYEQMQQQMRERMQQGREQNGNPPSASN